MPRDRTSVEDARGMPCLVLLFLCNVDAGPRVAGEPVLPEQQQRLRPLLELAPSSPGWMTAQPHADLPSLLCTFCCR